MVSDSLPLVVLPPRLELIVRISTSVPEVVPDGATTTSEPRADTGTAVFEVRVKDEAECVSISIQPDDSPVIVALSVSSPSPVAVSPLSVTLAPPLKLVGPLKVGAAATPNAVTVRISDPVAEGP